MTAYDGFLLLGFGGPDSPEQVMPFLRHVTAGRNVPDERLLAVAEHYDHFGGVSPINEQNRALLSALGEAFAAKDIGLPLYWGNRNSQPWLADTVARMAADGVTRALVLATSATGGYSGCRQYRENLHDARLGGGPELVKLRHFFNHPGFIAANVDRVQEALAQLPDPYGARLVFTAHSVPVSMNDTAGPTGGLYLQQQRETARLVAEGVRGPGAEFDLAWQSRSGPPQVPWLEPDVNDHLRALAGDGVTCAVVAPTGFVSDHLEVLWDLDNEAVATAAEVGITMSRAGTAGTHPAFVAAICALVEERTRGAERLALGPMGPSWDECPFADGCCAPPPRRFAGRTG
ncbi:MAG: protoporphyrin/coproporphyrin ferrochelatase [Frankiales bacterium]|nr:protoporphyrin/coproporphyrin ferrochelatase [Frankiales bacterium]